VHASVDCRNASLVIGQSSTTAAAGSKRGGTHSTQTQQAHASPVQRWRVRVHVPHTETVHDVFVGDGRRPFVMHSRAAKPLHSPLPPSASSEADTSSRATSRTLTSGRLVLSGFAVGPSELSDVVEIEIDTEVEPHVDAASAGGRVGRGGGGGDEARATLSTRAFVVRMTLGPR
jgi:hypothetical protein